MVFTKNWYYEAVVAAVSILGLAGCQSTMKSDDFHADYQHPVDPPVVSREEVTIPMLSPPVKATFGLETQAEVLKVYQEYSKKGIAHTIHGDGFVTYPYDAYQKPIIQCAPFYLCVVELEEGEVINDIALGDSAHWQVSTALIGTEDQGSYQVSVKPTLENIATDMVITTNRRHYHLGLVSQTGKVSEIVSFYYPADTLKSAIQKGHHAFKNHEKANPEQNALSLMKRASQMNFHYRIHGDNPLWKPVRAFDDGEKTYIEMSAKSQHTELPVLYALQNHEKQLINYRYHEPYFIVDGLVEKLYFIAGSGKNETQVVIDNEALQHHDTQHDYPRRVNYA